MRFDSIFIKGIYLQETDCVYNNVSENGTHLLKIDIYHNTRSDT